MSQLAATLAVALAVSTTSHDDTVRSVSTRVTTAAESNSVYAANTRAPQPQPQRGPGSGVATTTTTTITTTTTTTTTTTLDTRSTATTYGGACPWAHAIDSGLGL